MRARTQPELLNAARRAAQRGFTLVEILLVVAIIGILVGIAGVKFSGRIKDTQIQAARSTIRQIGLAIDLYEVDNGAYPPSLQNLVTRGSEMNWKGPYLKDGRLPETPWGGSYQYSVTQSGYKISCQGPDGELTN